MSRRIIEGLVTIDLGEEFNVFLRIWNAFLKALINRVPPDTTQNRPNERTVSLSQTR